MPFHLCSARPLARSYSHVLSRSDSNVPIRSFRRHSVQTAARLLKLIGSELISDEVLAITASSSRTRTTLMRRPYRVSFCHVGRGRDHRSPRRDGAGWILTRFFTAGWSQPVHHAWVRIDASPQGDVVSLGRRGSAGSPPTSWRLTSNSSPAVQARPTRSVRASIGISLTTIPPTSRASPIAGNCGARKSCRRTVPFSE